MRFESEMWLSKFQLEKFRCSKLAISVNHGLLVEEIFLLTSYRASRPAGLHSILLFVTSRLEIENN